MADGFSSMVLAAPSGVVGVVACETPFEPESTKNELDMAEDEEVDVDRLLLEPPLLGVDGECSGGGVVLNDAWLGFVRSPRLVTRCRDSDAC